MRNLWLGAGALALLAGCASEPRPAPRVVSPPVRPLPPPPPPPPPPAPADWRDLPLTPGDWTYRPDAQGPSAGFGGESFVIRCDAAQRRVVLARRGTAGALTVRTTYGTRAVAAPLASTDPLLDQIAFSRGRFTVEAEGQAMLVVPAWPEAARVVEDCRS